MEKILIFGASRGLGAALVRRLASEMDGIQILGLSRNMDQLVILEEDIGLKFKGVSLDLAKKESRPKIQEIIQGFAPSRVFYVAGGGPYGNFGSKKFESHEWAWRVSFETPAFVAHHLSGTGNQTPLILIGSSVCEDREDPFAGSYSAAKHALFGLYKALRLEDPSWDLRLYSPGYMDTGMIPKNASVRGGRLWSPDDVARDLLEWTMNAMCFGHHKTLPLYRET